MKNILSIDCDVMFECEEYAKYTNHDLDSELAWEVIELIASKKNINTDINIEAFKRIVEAFSKCTNAKFRVIEEHDEIISIMEQYSVKNATVYNYDHHHDITYSNDDDSLTIENWARFGKKLGLIKDYHWINRVNSDIRVDSPFIYNRTCLDDVVVDNLNEIDLVVICISKHFTPKKFWNSLPNTLLSYKNISGWQEVTKDTLPVEEIKKFDDYLIDGTMPVVDRLFRNGKSYLVLEDKNISIFSLDKKTNLFSVKELVDYILEDTDYLQIDYVVGTKNESFIKRLVSNYNVISDCTENWIRKIKFEGVRK